MRESLTASLAADGFGQSVTKKENESLSEKNRYLMEENEKLKRLILQREEISKQVNQIKCNLFDYIAACLYYDKSYSPLNVFKRAKSFQIPVPNALYAFLNPSYPSPLLYLAFHLHLCSIHEITIPLFIS